MKRTPIGRSLAFAAAVLFACAASGTSADVDDLVEVYVLAIRAREDGESEAEVKQRVDGWLAGRGLSRADLMDLSRKLDEQPGAWARVWSRIDERLRTPSGS